MDIQSTPLALLKDPSLLKTAALVNGQWLDGSSRFDVNDPATGLKLADVANLGPADAEVAIAAANAAWGPWKTKTAKERSAILRKWFDHRIASTTRFVADVFTGSSPRARSASRPSSSATKFAYLLVNVGLE